MKRSIKVLLFALAMWALAWPVCLSASESPFDVGGKAQLFVDRLLVRRSERVWFTQHQGKKHPENPLIKADRPWEGWRLDLRCGVLYDEKEKLFKMWYMVDQPGTESKVNYSYGAAGGLHFPKDRCVSCYAVSRDGIRWEKPLVGTLKSRDGKPHNAVSYAQLFAVIKDPADPEPNRRYKAIAWSGGYHTFVSPDGFDWKRLSTSAIAPDHDVITGFWDPRRKLYVAFPKQHYTPWRGHKRRLFYTITSKDFVHWTERVLSWKTDLRDDAGSLARVSQVRPILDRPDDPKLMRTEFYGIGIYPAESCTIGFPWMLTINSNARYGNQEGPQEVQLAVSRDLIHWKRPFRTPVIDVGHPDQWDGGSQLTAASAIRIGDEIRLYYGGGNYTHGTPALFREKYLDTGKPTGRKTKYTASIGLVTWKLDRFVSADGPAEGGRLTTIPIKFSGRRLEINAATGSGGSIVVEICDAAGKPLAGFAPSDPFTSDELRHVVTFSGQQDLSKLAGRPISLCFQLNSASLYSFAFRN